jgi:hypothetical protein
MRRSIWPVAALCAMPVLFGMPHAGYAWSADGHRIIALIADRVLQQSNPAARAKLLTLLATDKGNRLTKTDIASEATWADVLRDRSEEARMATSQWHSVRFKPDSPDLVAACFGRKPLPTGYPASHGPADNCSVDKIAQFESELRNSETSQGERLVATQYLLNLVGDLHDPLHAIDHGDQEGACVALQIGAKPPVRLAAYWQTMLVAEAGGGNPAQAAARLGAISAADIKAWTTGNPEAWARDTFDIAKTVTYSFTTAPAAGKYEFPAQKGQAAACRSADLYKVGPEYEEKAAATVRQLLAKAGVRLAAVLNNDFK